VSTSLTCENDRQINAERYATRRMTSAEAEAFEDHFVACAECQAEVRLASAIAAAVSSPPVVALSAKPNRRKQWWTAAGVAVAAGLVTLLIMDSTPRSDLVALGGVAEPPTSLGIAVRSAGVSPDSLFESAMNAYAARQYSTAAQLLRGSIAAAADSTPAEFFLGASLLLDNHPREAVDAFRRVIGQANPTYRAEARYYLAKSLLRLGKGREALAELDRLTPADGISYDMGKALSDSVSRSLAK
jgi:TolA-binding protein